MAIRVRRARTADFDRIFEIEKRSYPPTLQATHDVLRYRYQTFGIWVAQLDGRVVGFFTAVPVKMSWPRPDLRKMMRNRKPYYLPWFREYERGGRFNTLLVTSSAVESRYQRRGAGTALVKHSLRLARRAGLGYRASALRCQYGQFFRKTDGTIREYLARVLAGEIDDRFLSLYLKLGFTLGPPLPGYEPDPGSLDHTVFTYKRLGAPRSRGGGPAL